MSSLGGSICEYTCFANSALRLDHYLDSYPFFCRICAPDPVPVCIYNANVAISHGRHDLQRVWLLAAHILLSCVSVEHAAASRPVSPDQLIRQVAELTKPERKRRDSGTGLDPFVVETSGPMMGDAARVKWGWHPLGRSLVDDM